MKYIFPSILLVTGVIAGIYCAFNKYEMGFACCAVLALIGWQELRNN